MSRRDDMVAALEQRRPEGAVPIWELEFHAWDALSGGHVVLGREFEGLSPKEQERAMYSNAEIMIQVSKDLHYSALTGPNRYWEQAPGQLAYYCMPGDTRFRQFEILKELAGDDLMLIGITGGILGANYSIEFCTKLFEAPEDVDEMARQQLSDGIELAKRFRDLGADAVVVAADIADNHGPFYNPDQMKRWIYPYLSELARAVHDMGMYSILHSDGNLTKYLDMIADTGLDALQAVDPTAGMVMSEAKQIVGNRLCLCGNINCGTLLLGTPEEVFNETRGLLAQFRDSVGLVLGASNSVQSDVPMENYMAMIEAWRTEAQASTPLSD
jgi:uroporphyrinogen decarboxylase